MDFYSTFEVQTWVVLEFFNLPILVFIEVSKFRGTLHRTLQVVNMLNVKASISIANW